MDKEADDDTKKKKAHCPMCSVPHVTSFEEMRRMWQMLLAAADRDITQGTVVACALQSAMADAQAGTPMSILLLKHAALTEFYFNALRTDMGDLPLTASERDQLETMLEDFHMKGLNLADNLQATRLTIMDGAEHEMTEEEAAEHEEQKQSANVLDILARHGLLRVVRGGDA